MPPSADSVHRLPCRGCLSTYCDGKPWRALDAAGEAPAERDAFNRKAGRGA